LKFQKSILRLNTVIDDSWIFILQDDQKMAKEKISTVL